MSQVQCPRCHSYNTAKRPTVVSQQEIVQRATITSNRGIFVSIRRMLVSRVSTPSPGHTWMCNQCHHTFAASVASITTSSQTIPRKTIPAKKPARKQHGCVYYTIAYLALGFGLFCVGGFIEVSLVPVGVPDPISHIVYHTADEKSSKTTPTLIIGIVCLLIGIGMLLIRSSDSSQ